MQPSASIDQGIENKLIKGLQRLEIAYNDEVINHLFTHATLLEKWNKAFNLTTIDSVEQILTHHLLDSASIKPWINGDAIIDVGSGAGFPGLTLAFLEPDQHITLLDSRGKKTRFIDTVIRHTKITNASTVHNRVESFQPDHKFDTIVTRAFASLHDMVSSCHHLMHPNGCMVAMKGDHPTQEIKALEKLNLTITVDEINVPFLNAKRHVVTIRLP